MSTEGQEGPQLPLASSLRHHVWQRSLLLAEAPLSFLQVPQGPGLCRGCKPLTHCWQLGSQEAWASLPHLGTLSCKCYLVMYLSTWIMIKSHTSSARWLRTEHLALFVCKELRRNHLLRPKGAHGLHHRIKHTQ